MAKGKTLADNRMNEPGTLPYCMKCPVMEKCDCVQYDGYGMKDFWCADNPREKRSKVINGIIINPGFETIVICADNPKEKKRDE